MNFSTWLVMQLHRHNLSQTDFAHQLGTHRQTVVKWVTNQTVPGIESISRVADWLATHETSPWAGITEMKKQFNQVMMDLLSGDASLCPLCGEVVATPTLDE
tara:strand:- start:4106 stop:4411 length:306 start_codon:yes stop_codon:yes gene_type:complete